MRDEGVGGTSAGDTVSRAYDALMLTQNAELRPVRCGDGSPLKCIKKALRAARIKAEHLTPDMDLWRNLEAVISRDPMMNVGAMWLIQQLRGPIGVPVIYGDVLITGRGSDGQPCPLSESGIGVLRSQGLSGDISRAFH